MVVEPGDVDGLTQGLVQLASDVQGIAAMGARARTMLEAGLRVATSSNAGAMCSIKTVKIRKASSLDVPDLTAEEPAALHVVLEFSQRVGRDRFAVGRAQAVEAFDGLLLHSGLEPRLPSRARAAFILLTIRLCSRTRLSRSRLGRPSLTRADAPLIDAETLFRQPGPPHGMGGRRIPQAWGASFVLSALGCEFLGEAY